uniref:ADP-ribosylation factor-like protein 13B n=1 Tax=Plectus sambesii TaxID=2011161 RepID=A0A914XS89_9BILA
MGNCVSGFKRQTSSTVGIKQREIFIAVVGVDDAGKTTVIKALNGDSLDGVLPTVGFNRFDLKFKKLKITVYDLGGDVRIRDIWSSYYAEIFGIIYVINAAEQRRMTENKTLLLNMIKDVNMQGKPILLLLNKQDKPGALDEVDAAEQLDLSNAVNRYKSPCRVETCSALKGTGKDCDPPMRHGFNWLLEQIENKYSEMEARVTAAVTELKARQAKERQERMARIRAKQEAEEAAEANAEQETSIDATSAALENGSAKHFRNRVLPFEPLPQIKEEGNNTSPYRDPFLSTSSAQLNGGRKNSRTSSSSLGVGQVPHLPPISPPQSLQRRLPSMNNLSVTASVVPISAHS